VLGVRVGLGSGLKMLGVRNAWVYEKVRDRLQVIVLESTSPWVRCGTFSPLRGSPERFPGYMYT